ncbi:MAG: HRDC domain-containing protein, partial [Solirubrobacteraceae bacterium]
RSIERFISSAETCRRRQILDHFGDREPCTAEVRCCDVCEPDAMLVEASLAPVGRGSRRIRATGGVSGAHSRGNGASAGGSAKGHDAAEEIELDPVDESAFEKLKAWRIGRSEGKPAFTVAANTALEGALRAKPATLEELIEVKGIGPAFCERHGESLLQVLAEL